MKALVVAAVVCGLAFPRGSEAHEALSPPWPTGCSLQRLMPAQISGIPGFRRFAPHGTTEVRVTPPKRGAALIYDGAELLYRIVAPTTVVLPSGRTYGLEATRRGGAHLWTGWVSARGGTATVMWRQATAPIIRFAGVPLHEATTPMRDDAFRALLAALGSFEFEHDRLAFVRGASLTERFTVFQAGKMIETLAFEDDRLRALAMLRPTIADPQYGHLLARLFEFEGDQRQAVASFPRW